MHNGKLFIYNTALKVILISQLLKPFKDIITWLILAG